MADNDIIKKLNKLIQLDIDAVHAYEKALASIEEAGLKDSLNQFHKDHVNHINNLSTEVKKLGGTPQEYSKDFKGYLIEGFTSLRSITGTDGALKAMEQNEVLTNKKYDDALNWEVSPSAADVIRNGAADEKRHLEFIRETLKNR